MDNLARVRSTSDVIHAAGTVVRCEGRAFVIRTERGDFTAKRAVSCLLEPATGDLVLLAASEGAAWVLSVLERDDMRDAALVLDGNLAIKLCTGRLEVIAQEGVKVVTGKEVSLVAGTVDVNAVEGNVALERMSFFSSFVQAEMERVKVLASTFDSVVDRIYQRVARSYRVVSELDQVKAERIDYAARKTTALRGENTLISAEQLVKVDGEQIHLG